MAITKKQKKDRVLKEYEQKLFGFSEEQKHLFVSLKLALESYKKYGNFTRAAKAGGISFYSLKDCLYKYPKFEKKWIEAEEEYVGSLEMMAYNRAKRGSDAMIKFLLIAKRPTIYGRGYSSQNNVNVNNSFSFNEFVKQGTHMAKTNEEFRKQRQSIPNVLELESKENEE